MMPVSATDGVACKQSADLVALHHVHATCTAANAKHYPLDLVLRAAGWWTGC